VEVAIVLYSSEKLGLRYRLSFLRMRDSTAKRESGQLAWGTVGGEVSGFGRAAMLAAALQMRAFLRHLESPVIWGRGRCGGRKSRRGRLRYRSGAFVLFGYLVFIDNYICLDNIFCLM
jgi:hypothetical protein